MFLLCAKFSLIDLNLIFEWLFLVFNIVFIEIELNILYNNDIFYLSMVLYW